MGNRSLLIICFVTMIIINTSIVLGQISLNDKSNVYIGSSKTWKFNVTNLQEITVEPRVLNRTHIVFWTNITQDQQSIDLVNSKNYTWKIDIKYGNTFIRVDQKTKEDIINQSYTVVIPENVSHFNVSFGQSSTTVDGSAVADASDPGYADHICRLASGRLVVGYEGGANDLWSGYSDDNGTTWTVAEVAAGTFKNVAVLCTSGNGVYLYYSGSQPIYRYSSNGGASYGSENVMSFTTFDWMSGAIDSSDNYHFVFVDSNDRATYYTDAGGEVTINSDTNNDTDECDIEMDSLGNSWVACDGTDDNTLRIWSDGARGWGNSNGITIRSEGSVNAEQGPDIAIQNVSGVETIVTCDTMGNTLWFCNSTIATNETWTCTEIDTATSQQCSIGLAENGRVEILYSDSITHSTANIRRANSTDFITWSVRKERDSGGNFDASIANSHYPLSNRFSYGLVDYVYTEDVGDIFYSNYTINISQYVTPDDTCSCPSGENWNMNGSDECTITDNCNLFGYNFTCSGEGAVTFQANLTNYSYGRIINLCTVRCVGGCSSV